MPRAPLADFSGGVHIGEVKVVLQGAWIVNGHTVVADPTCQKIERILTTTRRIATRNEGWAMLHRDDEGMLWELSFPESELPGGGPPRLESLTQAEADALYRQPPS